jgi:serine/threonine protein kinase
MPFANGANFAGYSILRRLGCGGMGDVYLVQHPRLPHWNALKVLSPTLTEDREFRDRFMRETPVTTTLYHPHILEVEYRGETDGLLWVTMDYVNGTTAAHLIANRFPTGCLPVRCWPPSRPSPTRSITRTAGACCTATSNREIFCSPIQPTVNSEYSSPTSG